jgi:biopolymer transport protein ExbB
LLAELLLAFTLMGSQWVLWVLAALSVLSIATIFERLIYFVRHRLTDADGIATAVLQGRMDAANQAVAGAQGLQAAVLRAGLANRAAGPDVVEEILAATVSQERKNYERGLAFLGTVGANAPFVGLFGTVLGVIKAFHELGQATAQGAQAVSGGAPQVMAGISEALVATAVGLLVAIPAVVAFNALTRWLNLLTTSAQTLGHALIAHLRTTATPAP